jgi:hypothetical protein
MLKVPRFTIITHSQKYEKKAVQRNPELALLGPYFPALTTYCNIIMAASE